MMNFSRIGFVSTCMVISGLVVGRTIYIESRRVRVQFQMFRELVLKASEASLLYPYIAGASTEKVIESTIVIAYSLSKMLWSTFLPIAFRIQ